MHRGERGKRAKEEKLEAKRRREFHRNCNGALHIAYRKYRQPRRLPRSVSWNDRQGGLEKGHVPPVTSRAANRSLRRPARPASSYYARAAATRSASSLRRLLRPFTLYVAFAPPPSFFLGAHARSSTRLRRCLAAAPRGQSVAGGKQPSSLLPIYTYTRFVLTHTHEHETTSCQRWENGACTCTTLPTFEVSALSLSRSAIFFFNYFLFISTLLSVNAFRCVRPLRRTPRYGNPGDITFFDLYAREFIYFGNHENLMEFTEKKKTIFRHFFQRLWKFFDSFFGQFHSWGRNEPQKPIEQPVNQGNPFFYHFSPAKSLGDSKFQKMIFF